MQRKRKRVTVQKAPAGSGYAGKFIFEIDIAQAIDRLRARFNTLSPKQQARIWEGFTIACSAFNPPPATAADLDEFLKQHGCDPISAPSARPPARKQRRRAR